MSKLFYYKAHEVCMYVLVMVVTIYNMMTIFASESGVSFLIGLFVLMCELLGVIFIIGVVDYLMLNGCVGRYYNNCDPIGATEYIARIIDYYYSTNAKRAPRKVIALELKYINASCNAGWRGDAGKRLVELDEKYINKYSATDALYAQYMRMDIALATEDMQTIMTAYKSYAELVEQHNGMGSTKSYMNSLIATQIRIDLLKGNIDQQDIWLKASIENEKMLFTKIGRTFLLGEVYLKQNRVELAMEQFQTVIDRGNKHWSVANAKSYIETYQK